MTTIEINQPETTYVNGGVTNGLRKLFMKSGWKPSAEEALTMAAHATFPTGIEYTQSQLDAKRIEIAEYADRMYPVWRDDKYLDIYGVPTPPARPKRLSAYDKANRKP